MKCKSFLERAAGAYTLNWKLTAMLSIVIPIHNEEPSILPLYDRLTAVLEPLQKQYEIIFVDDASTDRSFDLWPTWLRRTRA